MRFLFAIFFVASTLLASTQSFLQSPFSDSSDFEQTFCCIDSLISAENSAFASLRPAWQACVHYATVDTTSTEQLFCAIAILRKTLTVLRRTISASLFYEIDRIEHWCNLLAELAASDNTEEKLSVLLRGKSSYKKKKKGGRAWHGFCACLVLVGGACYWWHVRHRGANAASFSETIENVQVEQDQSLEHPVYAPLRNEGGNHIVDDVVLRCVLYCVVGSCRIALFIVL